MTREKDSTRCVFPFTFKGKTYLRCTADESVNAKEWCATEVDADGEVITGQWGDCDFGNIKCFALGGRPASSQQRTSRPPPPQQRPAPRQRLLSLEVDTTVEVLKILLLRISEQDSHFAVPDGEDYALYLQVLALG